MNELLSDEESEERKEPRVSHFRTTLHLEAPEALQKAIAKEKELLANMKAFIEAGKACSAAADLYAAAGSKLPDIDVVPLPSLDKLIASCEAELPKDDILIVQEPEFQHGLFSGSFDPSSAALASREFGLRAIDLKSSKVVIGGLGERWPEAVREDGWRSAFAAAIDPVQPTQEIDAVIVEADVGSDGASSQEAVEAVVRELHR